jgi:GNAT superfamily N-acetyltransferase
VAKALIEAASAGLRKAGAREALLWVGEENPRARRFYEREGWTHDGTSRASELGPTELRYRLTLGFANSAE